mmetsp:Transcript_47478/g.47906  ORF Transcript_47478/g.47906 Transcript_47478/m.47906 type:complete len:85 (-) Transcript_47478:145-399(-)
MVTSVTRKAITASMTIVEGNRIFESEAMRESSQQKKSPKNIKDQIFVLASEQIEFLMFITPKRTFRKIKYTLCLVLPHALIQEI